MEIKIILNGEPIAIDARSYSYDDIVSLAFPDGPYGSHIIYTVTYSDAGSDKSLIKGKFVGITNGMIINVGSTDLA